MSLRLWLPLNGDLHNQGLDDVTVTNNGATVNNSGKIGKCYEFAKNAYLDIDKSAMTDMTSASVCFWVKINSWNTSWDTIFQAGTGATAWTAYYFGILRNQGDSLCFAISNGTNSTSGAYRTDNLTIGEWCHVVCSYGDSKCKTYLNGELCNEYTASIIPNFSGITSIKVGGLASTYKCDCLLSDLRIYDHALSLKEAKELSKGLVLHYPLSDPYVESTTNLITSEDCLSSTCYNGATSKYSYGKASDMYKTVTTFEGRKGTKVYMGTDGKAAYPYVYINNMYTSNGTNSPEYKTLSFDYYTTISTSISPYKLGNGTGTATYKVTNTTTKTGTGTNSVVIPVMPNMWNHIEITFHGTTDADAQWGYIQNQPSHTSDTSNFWFFANMQLEAKDHATGYTPFGTTRNENIVYDVSGYQNNGEWYSYDANGSIECASDTPRYNVSTHIVSANPNTNAASGTRYLYGHCSITNPTEMTVAFWCKPIQGYGGTNQGQFCTTNYEYGNVSAGSDYQASAMNQRDNTVDINSTTQCRVNIAFTANEWHHYAITYDGQTGRSYKDGVLQDTKSFSSALALDSFIGVIIGFSKAGGVWRRNDSYYSDFRLYTTALSADDILALYHTPASIANNGTLLTQGEISEV